MAATSATVMVTEQHQHRKGGKEDSRRAHGFPSWKAFRLSRLTCLAR